MAQFEVEFENLEVALDWLIINQPETACKMGAGFWRFHLNSGLLREGLALVKKLLPLSVKEKKIRARLLGGAGTLSHNLGDYLGARDYFSQCLDLWNAQKNKIEISRVLNNLAWVEWRIGNYDHCISYSENALEISFELNDQQGQAKSFNNLAWTYLSQGLFEKAADLQRKVLSIHESGKNSRGIAFAKINLGRALLHMGKISESERMIREGAQLFENLKDQQLSTYSWMIKAENLYEKSAFEAAKKILEETCIPNFERIGDLWGLAFSHYHLGRIFSREKDFDQTQFHLTKSLDLFRSSHDKFGEANASLWLSKYHWAKGDLIAGEEYLDQSLILAANMGANDLLKDGHLEKAFRAQKQEAFTTALAHFAVADHYAQKLGDYGCQKFQASIQPGLERLRSSLASRGADFKVPFISKIPIEKTFLAKPLRTEALQRHIQNLFEPSQDAPPFGSPRAGEDGLSDSYKEEDPFIRQVRQIIEKHLQESQFSIKDLCLEVGMSHSQLHRRLSGAKGQSISKFIRSIRLQKAKELLLDPKLTITAVAYDTGFRDPDYFFRVFKQTFEMTPNEFRKSAQKNI